MTDRLGFMSAAVALCVAMLTFVTILLHAGHMPVRSRPKPVQRLISSADGAALTVAFMAFHVCTSLQANFNYIAHNIQGPFLLWSEALVATLMVNAGSIMMFAMFAGVKMTVLLWSLLVYGRSVV